MLKPPLPKGWGADYIQHNPQVADDKDGVIAYFEKMAEEYPDKTVEVKRAITDGQFVVLHSRQTWPEGLEYAAIDIFRLGDDVEQWDVLQVMPDHSAEENGMFSLLAAWARSRCQSSRESVPPTSSNRKSMNTRTFAVSTFDLG